MDKLINLIQHFGFMIKELNDMIHIPIEIQTRISWGTIMLIVVLYLTAEKYLRGKELSSSELMRLVITYMFILSVIVASYTDIGKLIRNVLDSKDEKAGSLVFIVAIWGFVLTLLIGLLGTSKDDAIKMKGILGALFLPIFLLMLTDGGILDKDFGAIKSFLPKFKIPFSDTSDIRKREEAKVSEKLRLCCRWLDPEEVESVIDLHEDVAESAVLIHEDSDGIIKPYAFVVLVRSTTSPRRMKKKIIRFLRKEFHKEGIELYKLPHWVEFIPNMPRMSDGKVDRDELESIMNY